MTWRSLVTMRDTVPDRTTNRGRAATRRRTNLALLVLVPAAVATGLFANTIGVDWLIDPAMIHGVTAIAIALLTPWKAPVVQRGLGRHHQSRISSLALLGFIAIALASGVAHSTGTIARLGPLTIMQIHIGAALLALALVVVHYRAHPVPVRRTDLGRRTFLRSFGLAAGAVATWITWEGVLTVTGSRGANRRFTGSHQRGSFDPAAMPVTSWLDDAVQRIDARTWHVDVAGRRLGIDDLAAVANDDLTAILDCTSGWYSEQRWTGVRLDRLVDTSQRSIDVTSATGYGRRFPTRDLDRLWLVTAAGGEPLSAGHGFPARIVAPGRRGFWWVKWVVSIQPTDTPWWIQLPFPAT